METGPRDRYILCIKHNVENKSEIKVLRLKGKARIKEDEAKFIFSIKF